MTSATLDFYYEFASPYSYLTAMRITPLAEAAGVLVRWKPFLLGPIFSDQGYTSSPFNVFPIKGAHMWVDMDRLVARDGLPPVTRPDPFPANGLLAARVAIFLNDASRPSFSRAVFQAEFSGGRDIGERETVRQVLASLGHFCADIMAEAEAPANKDRLRAQTQEAKARGVFGAPSFITSDGALFWGNDRLEMALEHAARLAKAA
ncbi:2-hydroxychromene-2-carboxylate isomerase [Xanthobacter agilis]|uniref:2-hydroxychromene-2-carboxylate isomerase n=1 Tax=Xanthobacter agilis TaxID=47492 RepID=A0ABU0LGW6_XANAG|nr:2-hydroxychromene-2-carboxylate isomerase [Xanthobacter agilis]MDQ0506386.1 2-hydroxychromene-2-carboxylate isomerase [Xanthobacter agilis]